MKYPDDLRYTKDHEWARNENGIVTVGITDFAQDQLGDIVYIEMPNVGDPVQKGKAFGVVESVKAVSDLYSPISGEVVKINQTLKDSPEMLNQNPYDAGWMIHVKMNENETLNDLMDASMYQKFCEES